MKDNFTILELSCEFPQILSTVLYEIITVMLAYHKFSARWVSEMLTGARERQRMASALTLAILERYHKDGDEFLNQIVTGYETLGSFVNVKAKEKSNKWMYTHSPNKPKKLKQTCARKL
jgi:hypothetical protein